MDCGMDVLIYGDIPNGSGLSSSASLEVLTGVMLKDLYGFEVSLPDIALIGQYSEKQFQWMQLRNHGSVRKCNGKERPCDLS